MAANYLYGLLNGTLGGPFLVETILSDKGPQYSRQSVSELKRLKALFEENKYELPAKVKGMHVYRIKTELKEEEHEVRISLEEIDIRTWEPSGEE